MRLLRLQGPDAGPTLDFHPYVTVVSGLSGAAREQVIGALSAIPTGSDPGLTGLVEAHGVLLDLDVTTLELLDFDEELDVVVRADDLDRIEGEPLAPPPVAPTPSTALTEAQQAARDARAAYEVLRDALEGVRQSYRDAAADHAALVTRLATARQGETTAQGDAPKARKRGKGRKADGNDTADTAATATAVLEPEPVSAETESDLAAAVAKVERLRSARDEIVASIQPLEDIDVRGVEAALADVHESATVVPMPDPEAIALADELAEADAAVDAYDRRREAEGRGPEAARRRLDAAQSRLREMEAAQGPRSFDPADVVALEEAHDAVTAAEQKASAARLSSKGLKKKFDEAVAAEAEILNRLGFPTYTAYVMSTTSPTVSPEAKAALEAAQVELVEAEAAYADVSAQNELEPERLVLVNGAIAVREAAQEYVGPTNEPDLQKALRAMTILPEGAGAAAEAAIEKLRLALEEVGVDFGDLELSADDVTDVATVWLADMVEAAEEHARLTAQLPVAEAEVAAAESELAALETKAQKVAAAPPAADDEDDTDDDEAEADDEDAGEEIDLVALEAEVEAAAQLEAELEEKVDSQEVLLGAALAWAESAEARLEEAERADEAEEPAAGMPDAPVDGSGVERFEWYLLARLASQRSVSYAGSVPLVVDDALNGFPDDDVSHLLGRLEKMADAVQVVYLTDDPRVCDWAERAGLDRAAVVQPY